MNSFFSNPSTSSKNWALNIADCGHYINMQGIDHLTSSNPEPHSFQYKKGVEHKDCYIIYIPFGKGIFETNSGNKIILPGDIMVLYPEEWCRYSFEKNTNWEEYWIGFSGSVLWDYLLNDLFPVKRSWKKNIGYHDEVIRLFNKARDLVRSRNNSFPIALSGIVLQLISYIKTSTYQAMPGKRSDYIYETTIRKIKQNLKEGIDFQQLAETFNISYPHYRKLFKDRAGIPLSAYLIKERVTYARRLLHSTDLTVEEISYKCGFNSVHYFSKIFRTREGMPPGSLRKRLKLYSN